jgi:hypothetical protein
MPCPSLLGWVGGRHKVRTYKEYHSVWPSSELGLPPTPHPQASVPPPPCFWGEGNTRWQERGWESPNSNEGHTLWYSLYVRTLWREGKRAAAPQRMIGEPCKQCMRGNAALVTVLLSKWKSRSKGDTIRSAILPYFTLQPKYTNDSTFMICLKDVVRLS